ncbi:peptidoglycan-binding domain-containing protein [Leifsonia sp. NPDC102414]|uniref:peptidoglycan-binding domain-containing protein n=1 Tax=Leifsonia sp. NPDC102414 TaxID=3364124 RepID=UPI00380639F9
MRSNLGLISAIALGLTMPLAATATAAQAAPASWAESGPHDKGFGDYDCSPPPYQHQSYTWATGTPDRCFWSEVQQLAAIQGGYTGPSDGIMGPNSWKGFQVYLRNFDGYAGAIDGIPGPQTYEAMQRMARDGGYTGPIDGVMGPNSWKGDCRELNTMFFGGW